MKFDDKINEYLAEGIEHIDGSYIVSDDNGVSYYKDKGLTILHREDGPAVTTNKGSEHWYKDGKRHRVGGPAVWYWNGTQIWKQDDECHREDGPAYISCRNADGHQEKRWYIRGEELTEEEFNNYITKQAVSKEIQSHKNNRIDPGMLEDYL